MMLAARGLFSFSEFAAEFFSLPEFAIRLFAFSEFTASGFFPFLRFAPRRLLLFPEFAAARIFSIRFVFSLKEFFVFLISWSEVSHVTILQCGIKCVLQVFNFMLAAANYNGNHIKLRFFIYFFKFKINICCIDKLLLLFSGNRISRLGKMGRLT